MIRGRSPVEQPSAEEAQHRIKPFAVGRRAAGAEMRRPVGGGRTVGADSGPMPASIGAGEHRMDADGRVLYTSAESGNADIWIYAAGDERGS